MNSPKPEIFESPKNYPDPDAKDRYDALVGLESQKSQLVKILSILINPASINTWANKFYPDSSNEIKAILLGSPLIIMEGDVGCGKTELASTVGDTVARQEKIDITFLTLSLSVRGQGAVGQMTNLITSAFKYVIDMAKKYKSTKGKSRSAVILLIDEADALTQSRSGVHMHHEDKAGVNAFIRGIDRLSQSEVPVAVIMCTNRLNALDPAVRRRALDVLQFNRPNQEQRYEVLAPILKIFRFDQNQIQGISIETGENEDTPYGYTFSDLTRRLLPAYILDAYPKNPISYERAITITKSIHPTPPFIDN